MWREKTHDLDEIEKFISSVKEFHELKQKKWEKLDEKLQMENPPGTPGEDWIIPPDEDLVASELEKDPVYTTLKANILESLVHLKEISHFLHFDQHHEFDWVNFTSPLIGNAALEDGLSMARRLKKECEEHNYTLQNLVGLFQKSKQEKA